MWERFDRSLFILLWQNFVVAAVIIEASVQFSEINGFREFILCDKNLSLMDASSECDLFLFILVYNFFFGGYIFMVRIHREF